MDTLNILYLVSAVLIFVSIMTSQLSARLGVPLLLFFLGVGVLAGEEGILGIEFEQYALANFIGQAALACILLDGGLRTSLNSFRVGLKPAVTLATWGVVATVLTLGVFIAYLLGVDWRLGLLIAAIVAVPMRQPFLACLEMVGLSSTTVCKQRLNLNRGRTTPWQFCLLRS